jgi:hypothetical protein
MLPCLISQHFCVTHILFMYIIMVRTTSLSHIYVSFFFCVIVQYSDNFYCDMFINSKYLIIAANISPGGMVHFGVLMGYAIFKTCQQSIKYR